MSYDQKRISPRETIRTKICHLLRPNLGTLETKEEGNPSSASNAGEEQIMRVKSCLMNLHVTSKEDIGRSKCSKKIYKEMLCETSLLA